MNIDKFKKGSIITRVEPIKESKSTGFGFIETTREENNYNLVGVEIEFIGIANGLIYYYHAEASREGLKQPQSIIRDKFKDGWAKYIDPKTL